MPSDHPPLDQLADSHDELDGCALVFDDPVVGDELLEVILLGDTPSGTPEAQVKLAFYRALKEATDAAENEPR